MGKASPNAMKTDIARLKFLPANENRIKKILNAKGG
jgi:hypothetical protein